MEFLMLKGMPEYGSSDKYRKFVDDTLKEKGLEEPFKTIFDPAYSIPERDETGKVIITSGRTYKQVIDMFDGQSHLIYSPCSASNEQDAIHVIYSELAMWCSAALGQEIVLPNVDIMTHQIDLVDILEKVSQGRDEIATETFPHTRCGKVGFVSNGKYKDFKICRLFAPTPRQAHNKVAKVLLRKMQQAGEVITTTFDKSWIKYEDRCVQDTYEWFLCKKGPVITFEGDFKQANPLSTIPVIISGSSATYTLNTQVDCVAQVYCEGEVRASFPVKKHKVLTGDEFGSCVKTNERYKVYQLVVCLNGQEYGQNIIINHIRVCDYLDDMPFKSVLLSKNIKAEYRYHLVKQQEKRDRGKNKSTSKKVMFGALMKVTRLTNVTWMQQYSDHISRVGRSASMFTSVLAFCKAHNIDYSRIKLGKETCVSAIKSMLKIFGDETCKINFDKYVKMFYYVCFSPYDCDSKAGFDFAYIDDGKLIICQTKGGSYVSNTVIYNGYSYRGSNYVDPFTMKLNRKYDIVVDSVDTFILNYCQPRYRPFVKIMLHVKEYTNIDKKDLMKRILNLEKNYKLDRHKNSRVWRTIRDIGSKIAERNNELVSETEIREEMRVDS